MTRAVKLFLSVAVVTVIMLAGYATAGAQTCPPGWSQKTKGISWGGCLFEVTYCVSPTTPVEIIIVKVRNMVPTPCGDGTLLTLLQTAEKGVIASEIGGGGEEPDHLRCTQPLVPTIYKVKRSLCYDFRGVANGWIACPDGFCEKTYSVVCDPVSGMLNFTLMGLVASGGCVAPPGWSCSDPVPCVP